jgi:hypothetical protein
MTVPQAKSHTQACAEALDVDARAWNLPGWSFAVLQDDEGGQALLDHDCLAPPKVVLRDPTNSSNTNQGGAALDARACGVAVAAPEGPQDFDTSKITRSKC